MKIYLKDLGGSTFRFYLADKFREKIFTKLKLNFKDWEFVSNEIGINKRHLFGLRRGWELREKRKLPFLINPQIIFQLSKISKISINEFERNITHIKHGQIGKIHKIKLPLNINSKELKIHSINSSLFDYKYSKNYLLQLKSQHKLKDRQEKIIIEPKINPDYINSLRLRGLMPKLFQNTLTYRIPGSSNIKEIYIPQKIVFEEFFAKQFGKWCGDGCGGIRKIGVANKNYIFVKEFETLILQTLMQKNYDFYLTYNKKFTPDSNLIELANGKIKMAPTQYGDYVFRVETSNALLRREVFDYLKENLLTILLSSENRIRYSYYAGLMEAEGSINKDNTITIAFGATLSDSKTNHQLLLILRRAVELCFLLELDGFKPRISRKISNTKKTNTIKYDVNLLVNAESRLAEVNFIKNTIGLFLTHNEKVEKLLKLEGNLKKTAEKQTKTKEEIVEKSIAEQPVVNIGMVGHVDNF